jgi:uncharacterized protein YggE
MDFFNNNRTLKVVGIVIVVLVLAKIFGGGPEWRGDSDRPVNTITVTGTGEVVVKQDIALISFGVSAENLEVAKAQAESATKMNNIITFLKSNGVDEKDIKTTNYSIYPRYNYSQTGMMYYPNGKQVLAAYVVSQNVEVKIRDISKAGKIIGGVGEYGVTDVSGLTFSVDKIDEVRDQARSVAIKDARDQAKVLANELGVKLVRITSFSENGNYPIYYGMMEKSMSVGMGGDAIAPQVPAGENKITSNVTVTYEIR